MTRSSKTDRIRDLNDALRRRFTGGQVMLTCGVDALPEQVKAKVLVAVRGFDEFEKGNDPYDEHDFGSVAVDDLRVFFKIDYYDSQMEYLSSDPSDPSCARRVMTIMLAEEY